MGDPQVPRRILTAEELKPVIEARRTAGAVIVLTNGVFDLIHPGHIRYLRDARALGGLLVVAVNSDDSVHRLKGPERPLLPLDERMRILAALEFVDFVTSFDEDTPARVVAIIEPDILVKGGDYDPRDVVGRETVEGRGGRVVCLPFAHGFSTSGIVSRIREAGLRDAAGPPSHTEDT